MSGPLDPTPVNFEPRLSARRETDLAAPRLTAFSAGDSPRLKARHFASARKSPGIRPAPSPDLRQRRVTVVSRKLVSKGAMQALSQHAKYLSREGVEQDGGAARFFDSRSDDLDPRAFIAGHKENPGHYRLILNPEDGCELGDLRTYGRQFAAAVEGDVGVAIDWIGTAHHDTGRPHLHLVLMDRSPTGHDLSLTSEYLNHGMRHVAETVATAMLGPRIERTPSQTIQADRLTDLDQIIIAAAAPDGRLENLAIPGTHRPEALRRLIHLERRGWARAAGPAAWEIPADLRVLLRQAAHRDSRERAATRALRASLWPSDYSRLQPVSLQPGERFAGAFVGVHRTSSYTRGPQTVVIDGLDGRLGHVLVRDWRAAMCLDQIPVGAVIEARGAASTARASDQTIAAVAVERGGVWSSTDHAAARPDDWPKFIGFHQKRVEIMSQEGVCTPLGDGRYLIPGDYLERAGEAERVLWGPANVSIRILDDRGLEDQIKAPGFTWLDRVLATVDRPEMSGPFGEAATDAMSERSKRLRMTGLGSGDPLRLSDADVHRLRTIEIKSVCEPLEKTGKPVFLTTEGQRVTGAYVKRVHVAGTPYAVLESRSAHHLLLWKPGMEACRGKVLDAVMQNSAVTFRTVRSFGAELGR